MAYTLTSGTQNAAHRRDVAGVVFTMTGTLKSLVSGIPDATFYWSTKEMASGGPLAASHAWEPYLTLPQAITEELPMEIGKPPPLHNINMLVRNLPFNQSESLLTAIMDNTWEWEGTEASFYGAYQRRGQTAAEIPSGDWITLRLNGQLGGPMNIGSDGFTLPLASREQVRRQLVDVREITSGDFPNVEPKEVGKVLAVAYGCPDSWIRARRTDAGVYGQTTDAVVSGTADFLWVSNNGNFNMADLIGEQVYIYRGDKVRTVTDVQGTDRSLVTVHFASNLDFNIPAGALVQQKLTGDYHFAALNQKLDSPGTNIGPVAFELMNGDIIPLPVTSWSAFHVADDEGGGQTPQGKQLPGSRFRTDIKILDSVQPPALIPRLNLPSDAVNVVDQPEASITQQPDFSTSETLEASKGNWPTGPGAASAAFDGNDQTGYSVVGDTAVSFTFPSVTGGNFVDSDTTKSTLHFISRGTFTVSDGGAGVFANVNGSKGTYTINLGAPENFNQDVRFIAGEFGGIVFEVWWTHELSATIDLTRDDDTEVATSDVVISSTGEAGYDMVPIRNVVFKVDTQDAVGTEGQLLPNYHFQDMQMRFLGELFADKSDWMNEDTYAAARLRYLANGVALHYVIDRQFTWPELEADVALAAKSYAFYGPNGHELHYIEDASTVESVVPVAEFVLPGCPNANAVQSAGSPIMERTPLSQLVNTVRVYYARNWMLPRSSDVEERFDNYVEASNAAAVAKFGRRIDGIAPIASWPSAHGYNCFLTETPVERWYTNYDGVYAIETLAQYLADRYASGATRFTFDTAGSVVGVQRGDIVRVSWATAASPPVYRNALCEVEYVKQSPINVNRFTLTCRTVGSVQKGLTTGTIWTDLFTSLSDTWADKITSTLDRWDQYWRTS